MLTRKNDLFETKNILRLLIRKTILVSRQQKPKNEKIKNKSQKYTKCPKCSQNTIETFKISKLPKWPKYPKTSKMT